MSNIDESISKLTGVSALLHKQVSQAGLLASQIEGIFASVQAAVREEVIALREENQELRGSVAYLEKRIEEIEAGTEAPDPTEASDIH